MPTGQNAGNITKIDLKSRPITVISTFDAKGIDNEDVEFVMNIFTDSYAKLKVARIVDRKSFDKIKKELSFQESNWSDSNKVAELGRALNATQVVVGQLLRRDGKIYLTVKVLDVNSTTILSTHMEEIGSIDNIYNSIPIFCENMAITSGQKVAKDKPVVVISTFDAKEIENDDLDFVMNTFTSNFAKLGVANVVDRKSFDKIKKELSFQESDWSDSNKVAELGRALNANEIIVGELSKRKDKIFLMVKVLDVNTTTIVNVKTLFIDSIDALHHSMGGFCAELMEIEGTSYEANKNTKKTYKIGDEGPGGGIVFYISKEGFRVYDGKGGSVVCYYLEMSKNTLGKSKWFPEYSNIGTQTGLGYGKSNTYKIVNAGTSKGLTEENCAAYRCSKYSTSSTKAGDWWLPSKDELDLIYQNQKKHVLASSTDKWHWSSSESSYCNAWLKEFGDSDWYYNLKDNLTISVLAVRAF